MLRADFPSPDRITTTLVAVLPNEFENLLPTYEKYTGVYVSLEGVNLLC